MAPASIVWTIRYHRKATPSGHQTDTAQGHFDRKTQYIEAGYKSPKPKKLWTQLSSLLVKMATLER